MAVSFEAPEYTANVDALGTLRILEAVRICGLVNKTRIYQASTSELYGLVRRFPSAKPPPSTPAALRRRQALRLLDHGELSEAYGMYACNGLLFNHESPRRVKPS